MSVIEQRGAGVLVRAGGITVEKAREAIARVLGSTRYRDGALAAQRALRAHDSTEQFSRFVDGALAPRSPEAPRDATSLPKRAASLLGALALVAALGHATNARADTKTEVTPPAALAPPTNEIRFSTTLSNTRGHVICTLFKQSGWLKVPFQIRKSAITKGLQGARAEALCVFSGIEPGLYAICAFQDENDNGNIDTNFLGIPTEDWCTSRNAHGFMGPPSFNSAKFQYQGRVMRLGAPM
jgi:uncharacterized protein (DUF2141 family)